MTDARELFGTPTTKLTLAGTLASVPLICPRGEGHSDLHAPDNCLSRVPDYPSLTAAAYAYFQSLWPSEHEIARRMHDAYEHAARSVGWQTQEACRVDFDALPPANKMAMMITAQAIRALLESKLTNQPGATQEP